MANYDTYREKIEGMLDQLFMKPDLSPAELKNANEALCALEHLDKLNRGEAMREEYGYSANMPSNPWHYAGDTYESNNSYGRRMRSSTTGRFMGNQNGIYGHSIPDRMVASLEDLMDQANNDYERQMIKQEIQEIRSKNMM